MWENLPVEIQLTCSLVCKKWRTAAEYEIYSYVVIKRVQQLAKLNELFRNDSRLVYLVEKVKIISPASIIFPVNSVYKLLSYVPNLQQFFSRPPYYVEVAKLLIESKLDRLTSISVPPLYSYDYSQPEDLKGYADCAILLKDRLEELFLTDSHALSFHNNRLYQQLPGFNTLKKISIKIKPINPKKELDLIIEQCGQTLQEVYVEIKEHNTRDQNQEHVGERTLIKYIPRSGIDSISIDCAHRVSNLNGYKLMSYICYKFPELKTLNVNNLRLTKNEIDKIFVDLTHVKNLAINSTFATLKALCDRAEQLPQEELAKFFERVKINNSCTFITDQAIGLSWIKKQNTSYRVLSLPYDSSGKQIGYDYFFEKFGSVIKELHLKCRLQTDINKILTHILRLCPSLVKLTFRVYNIIMEDGLHRVEGNRIKELIVRDCTLNQKEFESLFFEIPYIHDLKFSNVNYLGTAPNFIYLGLPNTRIENLSVDLDSPKRIFSKVTPRYIFLKVFIEMPEQHVNNSQAVKFYYKYDFVNMDDKKFKPITAEEYHDVNYDMYTRFGIGCRSIQRINTFYNGTTIVL